MLDKSPSASLAGCARSLGLQALIWLAVLGLLGLAALTGLVIALFTGAEDTAPLVIGGLVVAVLLLPVLMLGMVVVILGRRNRRLDEAFGSVGLRGRSYTLSGRQWHGTLQGRQVDAYFTPEPLLDLYVSAVPRTRLVIGTPSMLDRALDKMLKPEPVRPGDPAFERLSCYAADREWGRALFDDGEARQATLRLAADEGPVEMRQVEIRPDAVQLRAYRMKVGEITPGKVQGWLGDLVALAHHAEALPPPREPVEPGGADRRMRTDRDSYQQIAWLIVALLVGVPVICGGIVTAVIVAVMLVLSR